MLRETMAKKGVGADKGFRWRGHEITRFEGFSDAVFAFAVTLLIVSLEVPKTFSDLLVAMRGFGAFAICFALLMSVWYQQYIYFRRYGLQDGYTIVLNSTLLFVVLFYIYPLKFLFTLAVNSWTGVPLEIRHPDGTIQAVIESQQVPTLMIVYGAGFVTISVILFLLFYHALRKRADLELNRLEQFDTVDSIVDSLIQVSVGLTSMLIAVFGGARYSAWAGLAYPLLLTPGFTVWGTIQGRRRRKLEEAL